MHTLSVCYNSKGLPIWHQIDRSVEEDEPIYEVFGKPNGEMRYVSVLLSKDKQLLWRMYGLLREAVAEVCEVHRASEGLLAKMMVGIMWDFYLAGYQAFLREKGPLDPATLIATEAPLFSAKFRSIAQDATGNT